MTGADLAEQVQHGWIDRLTKDERATLAAHLGRLSASERVRAVLNHGASIADLRIDIVWRALGREANAEEYREIAIAFREAVEYRERLQRE